MFLWNSIWTMLMWNGFRLFVPYKSFEIMKSKGNGFWCQTWGANINSQDFSVWLWEGKTQLTPRNSRHENALLLLPEPVTLVSSHPRIWKCAECWRLFPINWQSKPLVPALSHLSVLRHEVEALDDQWVCYMLWNWADPGQWCPAALLCLLSQHILERETCLQTSCPKANVLCMISFS